MKADVHLILMTYNMADNAILVLLDKDRLPTKKISGDTPAEAVTKVFSKYINIDPKFVTFESMDYTFNKDTNTISLYHYLFMPSPVPNKRGTWHKAWEVYRNPDEEPIFEIIQKAGTKAFKRTQTGQSEF